MGNDNRLKDRFLKLAKSKTINDSKIIFRNVQNLNDVRFPQLIFVAEDQHKNFQKIFEKFEGRTTLLVTFNYENQRLVMINLFKKKDNMAFEINKTANILNNNLQVNPELILLGGTEIDVAKLYRKGQESLAALESRVRSQEKTIDQLEEKYP